VNPSPAFGPAPTPLLGELLSRELGVPADAIERGLAKQREDGGGLLGQILVNLRLIDEDQLAAALGLQAEMPALRDLPKAEDIPAELFEPLPINFAKQHRVLPIGRDRDTGRILVALADPFALDVLDDVAVLLGGPVDPVVAAPGKIVDHINKAYGRLRQSSELASDEKKDGEGEDEFGQGEELVDILDLAPIIRWVNSLMFQAVKERASTSTSSPATRTSSSATASTARSARSSAPPRPTTPRSSPA
jgi:general secretion pathway protein E